LMRTFPERQGWSRASRIEGHPVLRKDPGKTRKRQGRRTACTRECACVLPGRRAHKRPAHPEMAQFRQACLPAIPLQWLPAALSGFPSPCPTIYSLSGMRPCHVSWPLAEAKSLRSKGILAGQCPTYTGRMGHTEKSCPFSWRHFLTTFSSPGSRSPGGSAITACWSATGSAARSQGAHRAGTFMCIISSSAPVAVVMRTVIISLSASAII
jgi:hypothetical protein